jgi:hypothetical protein
VQDTATRGFMTEPINLISQVKNASLEIGDHQVIGRVLEQSCGELFFQCSLAPLQIANMMRLCHGVLSVLRATNAIAGKNKWALSRQRSKAAFFESDASHTARKRPLILRVEEADIHRAICFCNAKTKQS